MPAPPTAAADRELLVTLLARISSGDRVALAFLYRLTSAKLNALLLRMLRDREAAEEVLQDVYLIVWSRSDTFDPSRASPITWLVAIARNRAIDLLRSRKHERRSDPLDGLELPDPGLSAIDRLETHEERLRLYACLEQLEPRYRVAIRQAFFGGVTYERLAASAAVPLGTMKSWIRRGLLRLRVCMET